MRKDFIVYQTRREQVGILGLIVDAFMDALFGKKVRPSWGESHGKEKGVTKCNKTQHVN